jgi:hypothetical protein
MVAALLAAEHKLNNTCSDAEHKLNDTCSDAEHKLNDTCSDKNGHVSSYL